MAPTSKHQIVNHMVDLCHSWLSFGYKPGHGRDHLNQIYRPWKSAWDAGFVQDKSMSMDSMTDAVAIAYCEKFNQSEAPRKLQELLEEISLVWFSYTFFAEQQDDSPSA